MSKQILILIIGFVALGMCQSSSGSCNEARLNFTRVPITGLNAPVLLKSALAPNNREWLFIGEQTGNIVYWDITDFNASSDVSQGATVTPFVDLSSQLLTLNDFQNESRGLLGLAFHRNFQSNGLFYVFYSANSSSGSSGPDPESCASRNNTGDLDCSAPQPVAHENRLEEWKWENNNATMVRPLLIINHPFQSHNGLDNLFFDIDNDWLFLATGDGGCFRDPFNNAQNPDSLLGKLIQFNLTSNNASCDAPVGTFSELSSSCADFSSSVSMLAWGFRDPRGLTMELDDLSVRRMIIADDGEAAKEIDIWSESDSNFGWDTIDGVTCVDRSRDLCGSSENSTGLVVAPAAVLNSTSYSTSQPLNSPNDELKESDSRELVGGVQFLGSDIDCLSQAYLFGTLNQNTTNLWFILPADYRNETLDSSQCSSSNFNFTFSGLPIFQVAIDLGSEESASDVSLLDEYTLNRNLRSIGTSVRNDMIFLGTANALRGDGVLWVARGSSSSEGM